MLFLCASGIPPQVVVLDGIASCVIEGVWYGGPFNGHQGASVHGASRSRFGLRDSSDCREGECISVGGKLPATAALIPSRYPNLVGSNVAQQCARVCERYVIASIHGVAEPLC